MTMLLPGPVGLVAGGSIYDRRIAEGMRALGHDVSLVAQAGSDAVARAAWAGMAADAMPVIDGDALPGFVAMDAEIAARRTVGLVHHPVSMEPGLSAEARAELLAIERRLLPLLASVIVTSPLTAATLSSEYGVAAERISVVVPGTEAAPRSPGSGGPGCEILSIGTLLPRKGHDVLLRALARLFDLDWHLTIAGEARDAVCAATLRALAEELGVAQRVTFEGVAVGNALAALWARTDVFALATRYEGYGMAIAEALARGIPVAVTNGGAAGALVTPDCGTVCDVDDVVQFSKCLRHLIFDTALRRDLAEGALKVGAALPDWAAQSAAFAVAVGGT